MRMPMREAGCPLVMEIRVSSTTFEGRQLAPKNTFAVTVGCW